jgi:hypothetical protein
MLHALEPRGIVRHKSNEKVLSIHTGAYQSEYSRETLLGEKYTDYVRKPGTDWPDTDVPHHKDLTARLKHSYDILRRWDYDVPPIKAYQPPKFR